MYVQTGLTAVVSVLAVLLPEQEKWYDMQYLGVWIIVLFAAVVLLAVEMVYIYGKTVKGELVCWN